MRTLVSELKEKVGESVTLYLTLDVLRDQKHLQFILAHDKSGSIQLVISKKTIQNHEEIGQLLQGSTFIAHGTLVEASQSKTFGVEVQVEKLEVMSKAMAWPITEESSIDLRFDYRVVDLKSKRNQLMLKLRSAFLQGCREYLLDKDLTEVNTPKIMGTSSETGSATFKLDYYGEPAYLAQSSQFYKESLVAAGIDNFEIASCYRGENSTSSRHLTEFTSLDVEYSWVFDVQELMKFEEQLICHALAKLEPFKEEVKSLYGIELTIQPKVKYMTLDEAKSVLKEHGIMNLGKEQDLPDEGERMLFEILSAELIFVSDYPIAKRPFYHMWEREKGTTKSFDLIFKGIEITSGAIREHRYKEVVQQALDKQMSLEPLKFFLDSHLYGQLPHGGFAVGIERVISRLLGITVKESTSFPKAPDRVTP
jgi:aspartyl/asparaginyl-tRNA synthetase